MQLIKSLFIQSGIVVLGLLIFQKSQAQSNPLLNKKVGVYISSKGFTYPEELYLYISQFVKMDDKSAWEGRQKSEFLIRMGWLVSEQLQELSQADSVHFLNADLAKGKIFQDAYDGLNHRMITPREPLDLDYVLVISPFTMNTRLHKSVYIRSNRMVTDRINVKMIDFNTALYKANGDREPRMVHICYDEQADPKPKNHHFDFYRAESSLGKFLSHSFTFWWDAVTSESAGNCE